MDAPGFCRSPRISSRPLVYGKPHSVQKPHAARSSRRTCGTTYAMVTKEVDEAERDELEARGFGEVLAQNGRVGRMRYAEKSERKELQARLPAFCSP